MESKGTFFILIIVVAVLALTLAALAGYLFLVQGNPQSKAAAATAPAQTKYVPKEAELAITPLFDGKRYFNLKNDDPKKIAIIQVNVSLKHLIKLKGIKDINEKLSFYGPEIQELVVKFFMDKTLDDIKNPDIMDKASTELTKEINNLLRDGDKTQKDIVYRVIFSEWVYQ